MIKDGSVELTDEEAKALRRLFESSDSLDGYRHESAAGDDTGHPSEQMYRLYPEPERKDDYNEYIVMAKQKNDMKYFWFFLHYFEPDMNNIIKGELTGRDKNGCTPERLMAAKSDYLIFLLKEYLKYDETRGVKFTTFIFGGRVNPVIGTLCREEPWSYNSLSQYKALRYAGYCLAKSDNVFSKAVELFENNTGCTRSTAERIIISAAECRSRTDYFRTFTDEESGEESYEDITVDTSYPAKLHRDESVPGYEIKNALSSLTEKERFILKSFYAICPDCGKAMPMKKAKSLSDISELLEGSSASESSIEKAKTKALEKMAVYLWNEGLVNLVGINQLSRKKAKGMTVSAEYSYRPYGSEVDDCDGIIAFDFVNGTFEIVQLADRDDAKTKAHAKAAAEYILSVPGANLPKKKLIAFAKT